MKIEKISGGFARVAQIILLFFFLPLIFFLSYLIIAKNFTSEGIIFLLIFVISIFFIIKYAFFYADIYISNNILIIKKTFSNRSRDIKEVKEIEKALLPFTYCILFKNSSKVFFFSNTTEMFKQFTSSDPDKGLKAIRNRILKNDNS